MKYFNKKLSVIVLAITVILMSSCNKKYFYDGINDDPTQLKNPTPALMLSPILLASGYEYGGDESRFPSIFMQQVTGAANQSYSAGIYNISPDDVDNMWSFGFYGGLMNNTYDLITKSGALNQKYYHAIGQIVMANLLQRATDLWGDIPYSQAFKGNESKNAAFDTQESIYASVLSLLNGGIAEIEAGDDGATLPGQEDILYRNSKDDIDLQMGHWKKFAHALKARCFIHLAKVSPVYYDSVLKEVPLAFKANSDNAIVPFSGSSVNSSNPTFQFNDQRGDIAYGSNFLYYKLLGKDPRYNIYYDTTMKVNKQTGKIDTLVDLGSFNGAASSSIYLMTYDELKFIEAEAQFQKGAKSLAADAYNAAVVANLARTGADAAYAAVVAKTAATITLNDIMTQKYIALFLSSEVWTDWRRTGLPQLTPASGNVTGGIIPRALVYPSKEIRYNSNTPKNRTLTSKLWWDK
ncbi:MAG: SusD/RagB family nutrient-binding outer membrane lipoprotein [Niabella sp.]|nr:SusD/RagB family nutrient-binding outer membrane lipoprotein [Niabella sp.]